MITGRTKLIVILADPIETVRAPELFDPLFRERGVDVALIPIHVAARDLDGVMLGLRATRNLLGGIVTMPHKEGAMRSLAAHTPEATVAGAVNVFRRTAEGTLEGTNLDGEGFVAGLKSEGHTIAGKRVYIAGAGGAAAAIAFAVAKEGASAITIANRTRARAEDLVARLASAWPSARIAVGTTNPVGHDLVVNATPLGRYDGDALPLDPEGIDAGAVCSDILMVPAPTAFLRAAAQRGCSISRGESMLMPQLPKMMAFWGLG